MQRPSETLEQLVARLNAGAYLPPLPPEIRGRRSPTMREFKLPKGAKLQKSAGAAVASRYDWDGILNGRLNLIERSDVNTDGELVAGGQKRDFEVERDAMPGKIKKAARGRYKEVDIYKRDHTGAKLENDGLLVQARDMTDAERAGEDLLRAEEREEAKERRTKDKAKRAGGGGANGTPAAQATTPAQTA